MKLKGWVPFAMTAALGLCGLVAYLGIVGQEPLMMPLGALSAVIVVGFYVRLRRERLIAGASGWSWRGVERAYADVRAVEADVEPTRNIDRSMNLLGGSSWFTIELDDETVRFNDKFHVGAGDIVAEIARRAGVEVRTTR